MGFLVDFPMLQHVLQFLEDFQNTAEICVCFFYLDPQLNDSSMIYLCMQVAQQIKLEAKIHLRDKALFGESFKKGKHLYKP